jgi:hypothetical protein
VSERRHRVFPPPTDPKRRRARALGREQLLSLLRANGEQSPEELAQAWARSAAANLPTEELRLDAQRAAVELVEELAAAMRQVVAGRGR